MTDTFKIRFHMSEQIKLNMAGEIAITAMSRGEEPDTDDARELMTSYLVDENGQYLPRSEARRILSRVEQEDYPALAEAFDAALKDFLSQSKNGNGSTATSPGPSAALPGSPT